MNLGNQPKIPGQCKQNLRFIDQDSSNPRDRNVLRRAFGNQLFNTNSEFIASISFSLPSGDLEFTTRVMQNNKISQFNRSKTEFVFTVPTHSIRNININDITAVEIYDNATRTSKVIVGSVNPVNSLLEDASYIIY